jgi:D-alanine-D-alanine ligase
MRLNIGVIFGGKSVEHEISIISAIEAMGYADESKYKIVPIYIDKDNTWYTGEHLKNIINFRDIDLVKRYAKKVALVRVDKSFVLQKLGMFKKNLCVIDIVVPIGHGAYLEDGSLQGYLNMLGVPYAGPSVLGAALGQDKVIQKELLSANNMPLVNYTWFYSYELSDKKLVQERLSKLKFPVFIKPSSLGSSIGIEIAEDEKDFFKKVKNTMKYDKKILVEEKVNDVKEINISVLGNYKKVEVSEIEEINSNEDFYSFKEKYVNNFSKIQEKDNKTKPIISKEMIEDMKEYAINTFKALDGNGVARIDFLINDKTKKIYINEINTIPGSLSSYLWKAKKKNQTELFDDLIAIAIDNKKDDEQIQKAIPGNLLERFDNLKGSKLNK